MYPVGVKRLDQYIAMIAEEVPCHRMKLSKHVSKFWTCKTQFSPIFSTTRTGKIIVFINTKITLNTRNTKT